MKTLVLAHKVLSYSSNIEGSSVLSNELVNLVEENEQLHEKRISLLYGINLVRKKQVRFKIFDIYGLTPEGEWLPFKSHYCMFPHPRKTFNFEMISDNIFNIVRLLKINCTELKVRLESMRSIMDEAQNNDLFISDMLQNLYLNCEKLYCGIQYDIGFLTNVVEVGSNFT